MNELSFLYKDNLLQESSINLFDIIHFENDLELFNVDRDDIKQMLSKIDYNTQHGVSCFTKEKFLIFPYVNDCDMGYYNFISKLINNYMIYSMIEDYQDTFKFSNKESDISKNYLREKKVKLEKALTLSILAMNPIDREFMLSKLNDEFIASFNVIENTRSNVFIDTVVNSAKSYVLDITLKSERFIDCIPISQIKKFNLYKFDRCFIKTQYNLYFTIMNCFSEANKINPSILMKFKIKDESLRNLFDEDRPEKPLFFDYKSYFDFKNLEKYLEVSSNMEHPEHKRGILNLKKVEDSMIEIFLKSLVLINGDDFSSKYNFQLVFSDFFSVLINNEKYQEDIIKICKEQLSTDEYSIKDVFMAFAISSLYKKNQDDFYRKIGREWINGLFEFDESDNEEVYKGTIKIDLKKFMKVSFLNNVSNDDSLLKNFTGSDFKSFNEKTAFNLYFEKFILSLITLDNAKSLKKEAKYKNSLILNYEADEIIFKTNDYLNELTGKMYVGLNLNILRSDLMFLEPSFVLKENKYIIETNDKNKALFIKSYVKKFLLASRDMESSMKVFIEEYLMKTDVEKNNKKTNTQVRKF